MNHIGCRSSGFVGVLPDFFPQDGNVLEPVVLLEGVLVGEQLGHVPRHPLAVLIRKNRADHLAWLTDAVQDAYRSEAHPLAELFDLLPYQFSDFDAAPSLLVQAKQHPELNTLPYHSTSFGGTLLEGSPSLIQVIKVGYII